MTSRPLQPPELLDLADRLVGRRAGADRPRTVELRRGVSTAYYALFHELAWRWTDALLHEGPGWTERAGSVSRWVKHADIRQLTETLLGNRGSDALRAAAGGPSPDLRRLAETFGVLQDARHSADYDDFYDLNRALARGLTSAARESVALSWRMSAINDLTYALFLRLMLSAGQAKTRS